MTVQKRLLGALDRDLARVFEKKDTAPRESEFRPTRHDSRTDDAPAVSTRRACAAVRTEASRSANDNGDEDASDNG